MTLPSLTAPSPNTRSTNARHESIPFSAEERINFGKHWPNRVAKLRAMRALVETTFSNIKEVFGDRLRCRTRNGADNEVWGKVIAHNTRIIVQREVLAGEPPTIHAAV